MAPVPLGERALDGELARVRRVGQDGRHVRDDLLRHAAHGVAEVLVQRVHESLGPHLGTVHLALAAVNARLNLPELLLLLPENLAHPGLEVLPLDLEAVVHRGLRNHDVP